MAEQILQKRYVHSALGEKDWSDVVERVLNHVIPQEKDKYREILLERYFVPNSPTLVNAGSSNLSLSACYVVPFEDSLEDIAHTKYAFLKVCQKGGGCGTTLSNLRPQGMPVAGSAHSIAAGPIGFFSSICRDMEIMSETRFRHMAMMGTMSCSHPDIEKFILAKTEEGTLPTTNISVMATDEFMQAAIDGENWLAAFYGPHDTSISRTFSAKRLLDLIAKQAWLNGEPGLLFETRINEDTPYKYSGQYIYATNPCGEQPLPPYGVCNLGSIDLSKYYKSYISDLSKVIDWELLGQHIRLAVEFLDNIIDVSVWPLPEIEEWVKDNRPIGLGVMGFADLLLMMGIEYGSLESINLAEDLGEFIYEVAHKRSIELGQERNIPQACKVLPEPRRNVTIISVAPTGTISLLAGCSSGIEPIYAPTTIRTDKTGTYTLRHPYETTSYFKSAINDDPNKVVTWKEHIDIQAAWQKHCDSGISKTINFPNTATVDDIRDAFVYAWRSGCKGVAVYRDGSRQEQVLSQKKFWPKNEPVTQEITPKERPYTLDSKTVKVTNGGEGNVYITVSYQDAAPREVFVNTANLLLHEVQARDGFARLSSLALKYGVPITELIKELRQIPAQSLKSVPLMIAKVLEELEMPQGTCPSCKVGVLEMVEGCKKCSTCGFSECN